MCYEVTPLTQAKNVNAVRFTSDGSRASSNHLCVRECFFFFNIKDFIVVGSCSYKLSKTGGHRCGKRRTTVSL